VANGLHGLTPSRSCTSAEAAWRRQLPVAVAGGTCRPRRTACWAGLPCLAAGWRGGVRVSLQRALSRLGGGSAGSCRRPALSWGWPQNLCSCSHAAAVAVAAAAAAHATATDAERVVVAGTATLASTVCRPPVAGGQSLAAGTVAAAASAIAATAAAAVSVAAASCATCGWGHSLLAGFWLLLLRYLCLAGRLPPPPPPPPGPPPPPPPPPEAGAAVTGAAPVTICPEISKAD
jgi:hypothetical protein